MADRRVRPSRPAVPACGDHRRDDVRAARRLGEHRELALRALDAAVAKGDPLGDGGAPGAAGLALDKQNLSWVLPYHEGTVKAFKEAGVWKAEHDKYNRELLRRQEVLDAAWKGHLKGKADDTAAWMKARASALSKAGLDVIFE